MTNTTKYLCLSLLLLLPLLIWWQHTGDIRFYLSDAAPKGQLPYILSKLAGLYALLLMLWQMLASLWQRLTPKYALHWLGLPHQLMGVSIVLLVLLHFALFFSAVTLRQGSPAWGLFWPGWQDYYHLRLSLGVIAVLCLVAVVWAGVLRRQGKRLGLLAHQLYLPMIALVYWHAQAIGSEAQTLFGQVFYWGLALLLTGLWLAYRYRTRPSEAQ